MVRASVVGKDAGHAARVLFRERRAGKGGREFTIMKLRTMIEGAEQMQESLADRNEIDGPMFRLGNDPRVTVRHSSSGVLKKFRFRVIGTPSWYLTTSSSLK